MSVHRLTDAGKSLPVGKYCLNSIQCDKNIRSGCIKCSVFKAMWEKLKFLEDAIDEVQKGGV